MTVLLYDNVHLSKTPELMGQQDGRSTVMLVGQDTVFLANAPAVMLDFVRGWGKVKTESRDGDAFTIVLENSPFRKNGMCSQAAYSQHILQIAGEFYRIGYRIDTVHRSKVSSSDIMVFERTNKSGWQDASPPPRMWGIRMFTSSKVWTFNAPADIAATLNSALSADNKIIGEKRDGTTVEYSLTNTVSVWKSMCRSPWVQPAHNHIALMKTIEFALDQGWKVVGSVGSNRNDTLMFAHEGIATLQGSNAKPSRPTSGNLIGIMFGVMEDCAGFNAVIMNANSSLTQSLVSFFEVAWGGKMSKSASHEPCPRVWWPCNKLNYMYTNKTQDENHGFSHWVLDLIAHMHSLGYELVTGVRSLYAKVNTLMFRYCSDATKERVRFFGLARTGDDAFTILRPLPGDTSIPNAIRETIERMPKVRLAKEEGPGKNTGDSHKFVFKGQPDVRLTQAVLDAVLRAEAELVDDVTYSEGSSWIFKVRLPDSTVRALPGEDFGTAMPLGRLL